MILIGRSAILGIALSSREEVRVRLAYELGRLGRAVALALAVLHCMGGAAEAAKRHKRATAQVPQDIPPPYAAIVVDANARTILHNDKGEDLRHPASLTKVMTLFLLFERLESGEIKLDTQMPVSPHAASMEPTKLNVTPGDTLSVQDAIYGLVTHSANDAAVVVAEMIGGTEYAFAEAMTAKARELGMQRTVYRNASGLPDSEQVTTARDQALLALAIQKRFPAYYPVFSTQSFEYRGRRFKNHNRLLGKVAGMDGIKTGYIRASKFNLVANVKRDDKHLVAVVLGGTTARWRDNRMRTLIEHYLPYSASRMMLSQKSTP